METASLQSLKRGLAVLELYNRHNGAKIGDVASVLGLRRGTAYRIIETLRRRGYLIKGWVRGQYWLAARVTALNSEYQRESWIVRTLAPRLERLSKGILWPVSIEMIQGQKLAIRATAHPISPLTTERCPVGTHVGFEDSAAGLLHVAHRHKRTAIRRRGYVLYVRREPHVSEIAVPIYVQKNLIATLTARYVPCVLSGDIEVKLLADRLRVAAQEIAAIIPSHVVAAVSAAWNESGPATHGRKRGSLQKQS